MIDLLLTILAALVLVPIAVFCVECLAAVLPWRSRRIVQSDLRLRTVVLIPAHNEERVIGQTLKTLLPTLASDDRVLVVADNCTDDTAHVARSHGVEVIERADPACRGKGYALEYGVRHLSHNPPDVVFVLDADCRVAPATVDVLSRQSAASGRPVQALNLCEADTAAGSLGTVSELGFRFSNLVRAVGRSRLGVPCHLSGTGMAFPWGVLADARLGTRALAEDLQLGIDLAIAGHPPLFCPQVHVSSLLPSDRDGFISQRTRWEHGSLSVAFRQVPRLLWAATARCRGGLGLLALDVAVPPLALLVTIWMFAFSVAGLAAVCGGSALPVSLLGGGGVALMFAVFAGWFTYCRRVIPLRAVLSVPAYVLRKLPIYARFFLADGQQHWVRTTRRA
ncbi:MAG: glycosyltransferase [Planctomycetes bacterium]|nr:glycosyltransferase [Planctomycetota bacterium]